jgi:hypothetical protein
VFPNANVAGSLSREMIGFEKTFLGGFASLELRMPVLQQNSPISGVGFQGVGDLSVIGRYAFFLDPQTGNVMSAGLAITAPTGRGITTTDGTIHSTILQPWLGYIWNFDAIFVHAFHSVVLPSDGRDITLLFNDAGVSWWAYRAQGDAMLGAVVPTFEAHVTTPLNHRNMTDPITTPDVVVLTAGVHLLFGNTSLTLGLATPVTGPRVFTTETFVQLNRRF